MLCGRGRRHIGKISFPFSRIFLYKLEWILINFISGPNSCVPYDRRASEGGHSTPWQGKKQFEIKLY